jgi:hypothetical protein
MSLSGLENMSEVLYNILLRSTPEDMVGIQQTQSDAKKICDDPLFWNTKLDQNFPGTTPDGRSLIPSQYVRMYGPETKSGLEMYLRWRKDSLLTIMIWKLMQEELLTIQVTKFMILSYFD